MILVDIQSNMDANATVNATVKVKHDLAFGTAKRVIAKTPISNVLTHIDPV